MQVKRKSGFYRVFGLKKLHKIAENNIITTANFSIKNTASCLSAVIPGLTRNPESIENSGFPITTLGNDKKIRCSIMQRLYKNENLLFKDFQNFFLRKQQIPERRLTYYLRWASRFQGVLKS
jgi:hypothetical protein